MPDSSFFYSAACVKALALAKDQLNNRGVFLTVEDVTFWTRMFSLTLAKEQRGLGSVTIEEFLRIRRTTHFLYVDGDEGTTGTTEMFGVR